MKKIGIIGGLSPISSGDYYLQLSKLANKYLGGDDHLEIFMLSINPAKIIAAAHENNWQLVTKILINAARQLEKNNCACIIIPCNSLHKVAEHVQAAIKIPIINIIHSVGNYCHSKSYKKVALLGTQFTMEDPFYKNTLLEKFQVISHIPHDNDRQKLHEIIFKELCQGKITTSSKNFFKQMCLELIDTHEVAAIILGCTELSMLISPSDLTIPLVDTVKIHVESIVNYALERNCFIPKTLAKARSA